MQEDHPIVDQAALVRLRGLGGEKLLGQMIRLYLENARERLRQIEGGLAQGGSLAEAGAGAHSLKSSAANVGAMRVCVIANAMEAAVHKGEEQTALDLRAPLVAALAEAETSLSPLAAGGDE